LGVYVVFISWDITKTKTQRWALGTLKEKSNDGTDNGTFLRK